MNEWEKSQIICARLVSVDVTRFFLFSTWNLPLLSCALFSLLQFAWRLHLDISFVGASFCMNNFQRSGNFLCAFFRPFISSPSSSSVHFFITSSRSLSFPHIIFACQPSVCSTSPPNRTHHHVFNLCRPPHSAASVRSLFLIFAALISLYFISIYIVTTSIDKNTVSRASNGRNSFQLSSSLTRLLTLHLLLTFDVIATLLISIFIPLTVSCSTLIKYVE